jgi:transposase
MARSHFESETLSLTQTLQRQYLTPYQRKLLQKILQQDDLPQKYRQRIQIMLLADEGKTQSQICKQLGCSRITVRHWILVASSGEAHNWNASPLGRPKTVNDQYQERLKELVSRSPKEFGYPFRCWTAQWLSKHLANELSVEVGVRHINRLLKEMGLSTRPKPMETVDCTQSNNTNRLVISDLTEASAPNPSLWQFNSIR